MKKLAIATLLASALMTSPLYAENVKIAIVNLDQIVQNTKMAQSLNADLRKQFEPRQKTIDDSQRHLQDEVDQYTFNSFSMKPEDRLKLQTSIAADKSKLDLLVSTFQKDFATAQNQASTQLLKQVSTVIQSIGQSEHYDLIEQANNVFYISNSVDITKQVIDKLNSTN